MLILNRHVYRLSSNPEDDDKTLFAIPFSSFLEVITAHELQSNQTRIRQNILKRRLDGTEPDNKDDNDPIAARIARLKRTRVKDA